MFLLGGTFNIRLAKITILGNNDIKRNSIKRVVGLMLPYRA